MSCIEWGKATDGHGYGQLRVGSRTDGSRRNVRAHRHAWEQANGEIPEGMHVLHKCDNRLCINPKHLFLGTNADNIRDKIEKGRQCSIVVATDIPFIRSLPWKQKDIAEAYGITQPSVSMIRSRTTWSHIS